VVCLDDKLYQYLEAKKLPNIISIKLTDLEQFYPELEQIKKERSPIDYLFTLSPYYPSYILEKYTDLSFICTLDADQYFFSSADGIFSELDHCSVLITPHRFTEKLKHFERYGLYNVSFQVFKNDRYGTECLKIWREQCFAWCKDEWEDNKFADQKYLETWEKHLGNKVQPINNPALGLAPWNIENYELSLKHGDVYVNSNPLILFHYQGLRFLKEKLINSGLAHYSVKSTKLIAHHILQPIVTHLSKVSIQKRKDNIARYSVKNKSGFFNQVTSPGIYFLVGRKLINMDRIYFFNNQRKKFSGLFNRFKNIYGQKR
jgi:hypothetical protein